MFINKDGFELQRVWKLPQYQFYPQFCTVFTLCFYFIVNAHLAHLRERNVTAQKLDFVLENMADIFLCSQSVRRWHSLPQGFHQYE